MSFYPPSKPRKSKFWQNEKKYLGMLSFYKCVPKITIIIYASWDMECNRHNFCTFWTMFCPFTRLLTPKIKIWKKCKKHLEWRSYDVPKIMIIYATLSLISLRLGYYFAVPPTPSFLPSFLPYRPNQFQGPENGQKITENCHFIFCIFAKDEILLSQILHCRKQTWRAFAEYFRNFPYFTH